MYLLRWLHREQRLLRAMASDLVSDTGKGLRRKGVSHLASELNQFSEEWWDRQPLIHVAFQVSSDMFMTDGNWFTTQQPVKCGIFNPFLEDRGLEMTMVDQIRQRLIVAVTNGMFLNDEERLRLDCEFEEFLDSVRQFSTLEKAHHKLEELGEWHQLLATILFGYNTDLSERQDMFVRDYDRLDVPEVRATAFEAIRNKEFPFYIGDKE
jgi:hypothetical protein